jgi:hypothetical protein
MALINCPDCHKSVSDQAHACPNCGLPVAAHLERMKQEEEKRRAEEEALRQRQEKRRATAQVVMGAIVVFLIMMVASCISNASQHPVLRNIEATGSQKPGDTAFSARGKLSLQYSCESSTGKVTTVQFSLVTMHSSGPAATVWKKMITAQHLTKTLPPTRKLSRCLLASMMLAS